MVVVGGGKIILNIARWKLCLKHVVLFSHLILKGHSHEYFADFWSKLC